MSKEEHSEVIKPAYFAIIPARVRYAPELQPNAKLLYGEITALCNEKGYCWAGNEYFANLYGKHKDTISDWISALVDGGYLVREIVYKKDSKQIDKRVLRLTEVLPLSVKTPTPLPTETPRGIGENAGENNTMNSLLNTEVFNREELKKTKIKKFIIPSVMEIADYCKERNNSVNPQCFFDFYSSKGWYVGKNKMKDWKAAVRTWEQKDKENTKTINATNRFQQGDQHKQTGKYGGY